MRITPITVTRLAAVAAVAAGLIFIGVQMGHPPCRRRNDHPERDGGHAMSSHQAVAVTAAGGFGVIVAFQVALALGAPFGAAAFGGATPGQLPANLRIASAVAAAVWALAAVIVLGRAGLPVVALPPDLTRWGTWLLVGILAAGTVMNFASTSPWERYGWSPFVLVLAGLCLVVARMPATTPPA